MKSQAIFFPDPLCSVSSFRPCHICGNDIPAQSHSCTFCGHAVKESPQSRSASPKAPFSQKTVNLEQGLPTVKQALQRLEIALDSARSEQVSVLTLIHGYGSTGKGGGIRVECRKTLDYLKNCGELAGVIYGEDFSHRYGAVKQLLHRFPKLSRHAHLNRKNRGITLVILG